MSFDLCEILTLLFLIIKSMFLFISMKAYIFLPWGGKLWKKTTKTNTTTKKPHQKKPIRKTPMNK